MALVLNGSGAVQELSAQNADLLARIETLEG